MVKAAGKGLNMLPSDLELELILDSYDGVRPWLLPSLNLLARGNLEDADAGHNKGVALSNF